MQTGEWAQPIASRAPLQQAGDIIRLWGVWDANAAGEKCYLHGGAAALVASQRVCAGSLSRTEGQSPASHPDGTPCPQPHRASPLPAGLLGAPCPFSEVLSAPPQRPCPQHPSLPGSSRCSWSVASPFPLFRLAFCHPLIHLCQFQTVNLGEISGLEASEPEGLELSAHSGGGGWGADWWGPRCSQRGPQNKEGPCGNCRGLTEVTLPGGLKEAVGSARALSLRRRTWCPQAPGPPAPSRPSARKVWF